MSGLDLIRIALLEQPDIRALLFTVYGQEELMQKAREVGARKFLVKPLLPKKLRQAVIEIMGHAEKPNVDAPRLEIHDATRRVAGMRILLVEDNVVNQQVAQELFSIGEIKADVANNGLEAIEMASKGSYDAILMDCQMPELDGYQATRELRKMGVGLPIIAMTANAMVGDREKCLEAGMTDYIAKPIRTRELFTVLAAHRRAKKKIADMVDIKELEERFGGRLDRAMNILKDFILKLPGEIDEIEVAVKRAELKTAADKAHSLKGSAGNLSLGALSAMALEVEIAAKSGKNPRLEVFEEMRVLFRALDEEFKIG